MFTKECLLRNVGEAKMHVMLELTKLGYSPMYMKFENNVGGSNVVCEGQTWHCTDSDNKPYCIDCGENIDLFLAIWYITRVAAREGLLNVCLHTASRLKDACDCPASLK